MIDTNTQKRLCVMDGGPAGSYVWVPLAQLEKIQDLLDRNGISYWVDEEALSVDGKPEMIVINFDAQTDAAQVQRLLDSAP